MGFPDPERSRVVLIGTSKYEVKENLPDLLEVERSVTDLAATLTDPADGVVPESNCVVLADEGDLRLIGRKLRAAASQAEDLLLVYYAGHGLEHTAFTGRLLRLLREGVVGGPEFLTVDDLYNCSASSTRARVSLPRRSSRWGSA